MKIIKTENEIFVEGSNNSLTCGATPSMEDGTQDKTRYFELNVNTSIPSTADAIDVDENNALTPVIINKLPGIIEGVIINDEKVYFYSYETESPLTTLTPQAVYSLEDNEFKELNSYNEDDLDEDDPFHPIVLQEELGELASYIF